MTCGDHVVMPPKHGLGAHQQPDLPEHVLRERVQQSGERRPVSWSEPDLVAVQLSREDRDLMASSEDFGVLGPVAHGQQPLHPAPDNRCAS